MNNNVLLIGRGTIAVNCLNILKKHNCLPKVIICDPHDTGEDTWTKSLLKRAHQLGYKDDVNLFKEIRVNRPDFISKLKSVCPEIDIIFSVQPRPLFKMPFISLAKKYVVNLHFSPLPKLRGVNTCSWAFIDGLETMGISLHLIQDEGIDNGPVIFQGLFPITRADTTWSLFHKCVRVGTKLFRDKLDVILKGKITPIKQVENEVTYHSLKEFQYDQLEIPFNENIDTMFTFIRARIFPAFQLPYFLYKNKKIEIIKAYKSKQASSKFKKNVITYHDRKYIISSADGKITITRYRQIKNQNTKNEK